MRATSPPRKRVVSPSDLGRLAARKGQPRRLRVGGRVVLVRGRRLSLADACATVDIATATPSPVSPGDLVVVEARLGRGRGLEGRVVERYPAPESRADGEFGRFGWQQTGARLRQRALALETIRAYFKRQGFMEVDTPLRVPAPGSDFFVDAVRAEDGWLITSPEHHMKRLLAGGLPRIFQLCHCSRSDEQGPWHEPEFLMLEWYRAFSSPEEVMRDTEQIVATVAKKLVGKERITLPDGRRMSVKPPFSRLTVRQAFRRYAGVNDAVELSAHDEARFFELMVDKVEPALSARRRPVFLCDYPLSQAALARAAPHDPTVADRFELYVGGIELCNGFGELTDPVEQRRRFRHDRDRRRRARRQVYPLDERFLSALEEGLPPAAGNALGLDRLVALSCGAGRIADVQAFPHHCV